MENNNGKKSGKGVWLIGIGAAAAVAAVAVLAGMTAGKGCGAVNSGKEVSQGDGEAQVQDGENRQANEENWGPEGDEQGQEAQGAETKEGEPMTAMYIPFGDGMHIFAGEQSGIFEAVFPDEIYDINGNKIGKEQLAKGNMVKIYGNGIMLESYPGQYPGITRMEVIEEGKPSDADVYQEIVDEIYQEPDPAEPPTLNVEYRTDMMIATVMINRGGYEWVYTDEDELSNAVVADSLHVLDWKAGEMLADIKVAEPLELTLLFSEKPLEVEAVRYDAALLGKAQEMPEGEKVTVEEKDGKPVLRGVTAGYVYDITGKWENGQANYGFITLEQK